jgi:hypothetical protein
VGSKWLTLAFVGSLGLMASAVGTSDNLAVGADDRPAQPTAWSTDERRQALDLLRQAVVAMRANRFESARQLARKAAELNASYTLFDIRPEHVLAEVDRRERSGIVPAPAATASVAGESVSDPATRTSTPRAATEGGDASRRPQAPTTSLTAMPELSLPVDPLTERVEEQADTASPKSEASSQQLKARAIELLDQGLKALDERRLDDAERLARAALSLNAPFDKLEYKPEHLITEVGIARARQRLDATTSAPAMPAEVSLSTTAAAEDAPHATAKIPSAAAAPTSQQVPAATPTATTVAQPPSAGQTVSSAPPAASGRERAERLLQEALVDLREGHDEAARTRLEGALGMIHSAAPRPLAGMLPGAVPSLTTMQPATQADLAQPGMPRAGFPATPPMDKHPDEHDVALKPLHDPFLGDDATTTQKSTPGENSLREPAANFVPLNPTLSLNHPLPKMSDELPQQGPVAPPSTNAGPNITRTQATADPESQAAKAHWPEGQTATAPQSAAPSAAPAASSAQSQASNSPGGSYAPPTSDPYAPASTDTPRPGYFRRLWNAMTGN